MERDPYTYVTMSLDPDAPAYLAVSFYTPDLRVGASVLDSGRPYLSIGSREADITVSTSGAGPVTTADVDNARELFNAAARYLADCERLHDEPQSADSGAMACDGSAA
ncbi:hypothetical protein IMZ11_25525 [Microtetraspora sp. AC03309]|uniref:hypothetical protein n=1 Tax=Microtetraspora sp. AC03309 TaxID=2779376 RepID=UPI001E497AA9|nr:hypothetical protein [Microtetraspora sp. AC03309]MCC5578991.1 hypothetical protein [Microtetraspora sp. AC03309]